MVHLFDLAFIMCVGVRTRCSYVRDNAWVRSTRIEDNAWVIRGQAYEVYSLVQAREVLGMGP